MGATVRAISVIILYRNILLRLVLIYYIIMRRNMRNCIILLLHDTILCYIALR